MTSSNRPVRVLWLIKQLGPGGAERLLLNSARQWNRVQFDIEVAYLLRWNATLAGAIEATGTRVHCLDVDTALDPRWALRLARLVISRRYDIVHVHSPLVASVFRILRLVLPGQRPALVVTEHASWRSYRWPTRIANTLTGPLDDCHLTVSDHARDAMPAWLRGRSTVLVQGVPTAELRELRDKRAEVRQELGLNGDELMVITVANLVAEKNYPDLLRAAAIVLARDPRVQFFAVGRGVLDDDLQRLHRDLQLGDRFRFLGYREDAVRLMAGADIFALASSFEGFPVAIMEVLSVGIPVVATSVGGIPDAIRDGIEGRLVPPRRPDLLAEGILQLTEDPDARTRAASAALARSAQFDLSRAIGATEQIYESLFRGRQNRRSRGHEPCAE